MENKKLQSFKDLNVWQKSVDLAAVIYKLTDQFPQSELYGIRNQMRRSSVSISSNIAEGFKRSHKKEKLQFYNIAYSSAAEIESQIEVARKLDFLHEEDYQKSVLIVIEIGKMMDELIKSVNKPSQSYILNSILLFTCLYSIFYILNPISVSAAELFFGVQSREVTVGQKFEVGVFLDTQGEIINAASS